MSIVKIKLKVKGKTENRQDDTNRINNKDV